MEESRRRFLKTSGAVVGTGILGASAGCTGILGGGGGGGAFRGNANWFYEPGEIEDVDHYRVDFQANLEIVNHEDEFDEEYFDPKEEDFEAEYEFLDLDFDEVESETTFDGFLGTVLSGYRVSREDIVEELEDNDYEDDDEYDGFQVFLSPDEDQAVGLTNNEILITTYSWNSDDEAIDVLETAVDTYNGEEARYVDENDDFAAVTSQLNRGTFVSAWTHEESEETNEENGRFEGAVARGYSDSVNGETMDVQTVITFDDTDDIDMGDVEDFRDDSSVFDDVDDISLSRSGRSVVISGTMDTDDY